MNQLIDYALIFSKIRLTVRNNHNGKAYIGCVIFDGHYYYSYGINQYNIDFMVKQQEEMYDLLMTNK